MSARYVFDLNGIGSSLRLQFHFALQSSSINETPRRLKNRPNPHRKSFAMNFTGANRTNPASVVMELSRIHPSPRTEVLAAVAAAVQRTPQTLLPLQVLFHRADYNLVATTTKTPAPRRMTCLTL